MSASGRQPKINGLRHPCQALGEDVCSGMPTGQGRDVGNGMGWSPVWTFLLASSNLG